MTQETGAGPEQSLYSQSGVDARKSNVRAAFDHTIETEFPNAFCKVILDPLDTNLALTQHGDGDGSKFVQRLLIFAETGDPTVFRGAADDALQMNLGDIAASGFVGRGPIIVTDGININANTAPKVLIMQQLGSRLNELMEFYRGRGFDMHFLGGETGDLVHQVKSIAFDVTVNARTPVEDVIKGNVEPGDTIWGFASDGMAYWEDEYNLGIMSNGLTLARKSLMWEGYQEKYPHLGEYAGRFMVGEKAGLPYDIPVSHALISPTRHWALLLRRLFDSLKEAGLYQDLHGISMNTGGAVTKINNVGHDIVYRKRMPEPPPIFKLIQQESGEKWVYMFENFNCGVGVDVVGKYSPQFQDVLGMVSRQAGIKLYELGKTETLNDGMNHVIAETNYGNFHYIQD